MFTSGGVTNVLAQSGDVTPSTFLAATSSAGISLLSSSSYSSMILKF
jgi:hypothetical protein